MNASTHDVVTDVPESLVVLTHDAELLHTLRAVATDHEISVGRRRSGSRRCTCSTIMPASPCSTPHPSPAPSRSSAIA